MVDRYPRLQMIQAREVISQAPEAADNPPRHFDALRLSMLDWDKLWFDLQRFRRQRHLDNVIVEAKALRPLLETPDWYRILVTAHWWAPSMARHISAASHLHERFDRNRQWFSMTGVVAM